MAMIATAIFAGFIVLAISMTEALEENERLSGMAKKAGRGNGQI